MYAKDLRKLFLDGCQGDRAFGVLQADILAAVWLPWCLSYTEKAMHEDRKQAFHLIAMFIAAVFSA